MELLKDILLIVAVGAITCIVTAKVVYWWMNYVYNKAFKEAEQELNAAN